jgi:hypothetical protein
MSCFICVLNTHTVVTPNPLTVQGFAVELKKKVAAPRSVFCVFGVWVTFFFCGLVRVIWGGISVRYNPSFCLSSLFE